MLTHSSPSIKWKLLLNRDHELSYLCCQHPALEVVHTRRLANVKSICEMRVIKAKTWHNFLNLAIINLRHLWNLKEQRENSSPCFSSYVSKNQDNILHSLYRWISFFFFSFPLLNILKMTVFSIIYILVSHLLEYVLNTDCLDQSDSRMKIKFCSFRPNRSGFESRLCSFVSL